MMEIIVETIHCTIGSVKNDITCSSGDGSPNDHSQRCQLVSETDQCLARIWWHIVAHHQPTLIDRMLFGSGLLLLAFVFSIFPRQKRSARVL